MTESIVPLNYLSTSAWLWPSVRITTRGVLEGKASADVERFTPNQYSEISPERRTRFQGNGRRERRCQQEAGRHQAVIPSGGKAAAGILIRVSRRISVRETRPDQPRLLARVAQARTLRKEGTMGRPS